VSFRSLVPPWRAATGPHGDGRPGAGVRAAGRRPADRAWRRRSPAPVTRLVPARRECSDRGVPPGGRPAPLRRPGVEGVLDAVFMVPSVAAGVMEPQTPSSHPVGSASQASRPAQVRAKPRRAAPKGQPENSPAVHRWGDRAKANQVPEGRMNLAVSRPADAVLSRSSGTLHRARTAPQVSRPLKKSTPGAWHRFPTTRHSAATACQPCPVHRSTSPSQVSNLESHTPAPRHIRHPSTTTRPIRTASAGQRRRDSVTAPVFPCR